MKLLFLITKSNWGGAQKYVFDLASGLDRSIFEIKVICGGEGEMIDKLKAENIEIINSKFLKNTLNPLSLLKQIIEIRKVLKKENPELLHLNSSLASLAGVIASLFLNIKIVFTAHGWTFNEERSLFEKSILFYCFLFICLFSDKVICVSERVRKDMIKKIKYSILPNFVKKSLIDNFNQKSVVIHLGIKDIKYSETLTKEIEDYFKKDKINIVTIAELHKIKQIDNAIKAFSNLKEHSDDYVYHIIGSGKEGVNLQSMITKNDLKKNIVLHGSIVGAAKLLKHFDAFLFTSRSEAACYVIKEAAQAGMYIISHNVGDVEQVLIDYKRKDIINIFDEKTKKYDNRINKNIQIDLLTLRLRLLLSNPQTLKTRQDSDHLNKKYFLENMIRETKKVYLD